MNDTIIYYINKIEKKLNEINENLQKTNEIDRLEHKWLETLNSGNFVCLLLGAGILIIMFFAYKTGVDKTITELQQQVQEYTELVDMYFKG